MHDPQASERIPFGVMCRTARAQARLKQKDVAHAARISPSRLSRIESGECEPMLTEALCLMKLLGISPEHVAAAMEHRH